MKMLQSLLQETSVGKFTSSARGAVFELRLPLWGSMEIRPEHLVRMGHVPARGAVFGVSVPLADLIVTLLERLARMRGTRPGPRGCVCSFGSPCGSPCDPP